MVHRVVTVLSPGVNPFDLAVACEVFGARRPELGVEWYDHRLAGVVRPVVVNGGWTLDPPFGLEAVEDADTVIVPACPHEPPHAMIAALRGAYDRGARMVSFCGGAFALAAAGILDGRSATTHWMDTDDLARRYPRVRVEADVLYIDDGQVLTSAGTSSGIALALHLVRLDYGPEVANQVAKRMVTAPHREGGQSQFAFRPVPVSSFQNAIASVMDWMFEHLDEPMTVGQLARLAAMSPRTFARRFSEATGTTPLRWLTHQRILRAQDLLEATTLPVDVIASRVGLGTAVNLRQHFRRETSMTPAAYRRQVRQRRGRVPTRRDRTPGAGLSRVLRPGPSTTTA
jgi:AraC family transcriptional activator FtrA